MVVTVPIWFVGIALVYLGYYSVRRSLYLYGKTDSWIDDVKRVEPLPTPPVPQQVPGSEDWKYNVVNNIL